jgi:hypothetical protein
MMKDEEIRPSSDQEEGEYEYDKEFLDEYGL